MATAAEALAVILAPWTKHRNGVRHLILGDSGSGKSVHMLWLLRALLLEAVVELALVLDDKGRDPQFKGDLRVNVAEHFERLARGDVPASEVIVFRGDLRRGVACSPDELAQVALGFALDDDPKRVLVVLDEISRATSAVDDGDGKKFTAPAVKKLFTEGRALCSSVVAGNQSPQELPRSAVNNASTIAIHRMGPNAANYLQSAWLLEDEMVDAIRSLQVGQFVLRDPGTTVWDRRIYQVPPP